MFKEKDSFSVTKVTRQVIAAGTRVKDIRAGWVHTCAFVKDALHCWGSNEDHKSGPTIAPVL